MAYPDYKRDLLAGDFDADRVLDRYFHAGQSHVFYGADPKIEPEFKRDLAVQLRLALDVRLHPLQLILCGSAHLGFSPVPTKLGKPFDSNTSDIDVAIVSEELFDRWWIELQATDLVPATVTRIAENLFRGFIDPSNVHGASEIGRQWWELFGKIQTDRAKAVRGRLYRSHFSMQSYHLHAINGGRKQLQNQRV